tara:strand:- start:199 stop:528 length:330 start_codon:yes stop_codon:yes gene_type:complete
MSSANKLYKTSGSELPFKEWLRREQLKGKLDVHNDTFLNMIGSGNGNAMGGGDFDPNIPDNEAEEQTNKVPTDTDVDLPEITYNRSDVIKFSVLSLVAGMLISKYVFKK